ncbi:hypothetical protein I8751_23755 [Nostocaceae cyanobacterium CENA357]|uniref:Uncharacterized protein n=1 Tax=Atlanticothrix silvestris CENA357 TaxID=1725252 RepID=A0A8J7L4S4_9CYAN|nr:hypothetical protein [Atlanticothrix silvestris]MBH8555309.1 hypothetical protein [Atlanticothrix silvestris CENA357]
MNIIFLALPFLIIILIAISSISWQQLVKGVLFLIILDGALRKWILPQASNLMYLLKDFILVLAYIKYFLLSNRPKTLIKNNYTGIIHGFLALASVWLFFQSFNPDLGSPIIGIFGLSRYLLYVPLMWMLPNLFDSEEELYKFLRNYLLCLIPVCILGIAQFSSPASSLLNVAPGGEEASESLGFGEGKLRISSVFAFPNIYTSYLVLNFAFLITYLTNQDRNSQKWRLIILLELLLMVANFFMTGSRGVIGYSVFILLFYLLIKSFDNLSKMINFFKKMAIPAVLGVVILSHYFAPALEAFSSRGSVVDAAKGDARIAYSLSIHTLPGKFILDSYGTGATQSARQTFQRLFDLPKGLPTPPAEAETHRVTIEIGIFGFILWYGMRIALLIATWSAYRKLTRPFLKDLALVSFLIHVLWFIGQVVVHPLAVVYYWFLNGFIFLLPKLEAIENNRQRQQMILNYQRKT